MNKLKKEVLRYLAYRNQPLDDNINALIDSTLEEAIALKNNNKKYIYKAFDFTLESNRVLLANSTIYLSGKDISKHLKTSEKCIIIAATLGLNFEKAINYYSKVNLTKALIMDACGTALIEELCDDIEIEISNDNSFRDYRLTSRYSPGYGDFPIESQRNIEVLLETSKTIGLSVTSNHLLIPRKSVTAIIGLHRDKTMDPPMNSCEFCNDTNCQFNCKE
ncbi:vitamin B12 dependent-methionine synthase activation domain-containing protein [Alkaliphilus peptidifermentans]|uniref:Vitamin B12 dependent methionine synthase, activation domain n=1 Tax=Alkaliphilus peptidifermentans DSM 18978 TaxID=1120976 RepID=A0A1G5KGM5_9FIRM|nr:vitamin B12 dependent-methionine synthase activation domain-containing protein [Alkaliphilus peptidifermentans]SCY99198.1 Vitamin B12 dependent methionine synthase, activation domain [Alkaliphilus peptidifermentans DSM 18978]